MSEKWEHAVKEQPNVLGQTLEVKDMFFYEPATVILVFLLNHQRWLEEKIK